MVESGVWVEEEPPASNTKNLRGSVKNEEEAQDLVREEPMVGIDTEEDRD